MESPEAIELDRLYLELALARLQQAGEMSPSSEPEALVQECKFWQSDLSRKYAHATMSEDKMLRSPPKCLRVAATLLDPNAALSALSTSKLPAHQQIGYIVMCANKLVHLLSTEHSLHEQQVQKTMFLHKVYFQMQERTFATNLESLEDLMRTLRQQKQLAERGQRSWLSTEQNKWRYDARNLWESVRAWWALTLKYQRAVLLLLGQEETYPADALDELEEVANKSEQLFVQVDDFIRAQEYATVLVGSPRVPTVREKESKRERRPEIDQEEEEGQEKEGEEGEDDRSDDKRKATILMDEIGQLLSRWQLLAEPHLPLVQAQREQVKKEFLTRNQAAQEQAERTTHYRGRLTSVQNRQADIFRQVSAQGTLSDDKIHRTMGIQQEILLARQELEEQLNRLHTLQAAQMEWSTLYEAASCPVPEDLRAHFQGLYHTLTMRLDTLTKENALKRKVTQDSFQHKYRRLMEEQIQRFTSLCSQLQRQRVEIEHKIWHGYDVRWKKTRGSAIELEAHLIKLLYQAVSFASIASALEQLGSALQGSTDALEERHGQLRQAVGYQFLLRYLKRGKQVFVCPSSL